MPRSIEVYSGSDIDNSDYSTDEDNYDQEWLPDTHSNDHDLPILHVDLVQSPLNTYHLQLGLRRIEECRSFRELWAILYPLAKENTLILSLQAQPSLPLSAPSQTR